MRWRICDVDGSVGPHEEGRRGELVDGYALDIVFGDGSPGHLIVEFDDESESWGMNVYHVGSPTPLMTFFMEDEVAAMLTVSIWNIAEKAAGDL